MLSQKELGTFDKLREILKNEDYDLCHCGLICELYANGFKDGDDFHMSPQAWDDVFGPNPKIKEIVEKWRRLTDEWNRVRSQAT